MLYLGAAFLGIFLGEPGTYRYNFETEQVPTFPMLTLTGHLRVLRHLYNFVESTTAMWGVLEKSNQSVTTSADFKRIYRCI